MASKLKVDELQDELSKRGLSTRGKRPTLVKRLNSAIRKESVPVGDSNKRSQKREREKPADGDFNGGSLKIRAIGDLRKLSVKELREQASLRGVSSIGSKKELLERLCEDIQAINAEENKEGEDTQKGSAILDEYISDEVKSQYHVLQQGNEIYDATLNLTDVGGNNNKFYIIQALESNDGSTFMVYNRWGRVGIKGQDKLHGPYKCVQSAKNEFKKKFHDKTKNDWSERKQFASQPRFYTWLERDYGETAVQETKLDKRIADFISLISNEDMMKKQMVEIGYDAKKLPLRKLSKDTISKGYKVLKTIADVIDEHDKEKLKQLSGEFYTIIPHNFGFKNISEFVIDTPEKLKLELEMVEALAKIEIATKLLENVGMEEAPLLSSYERLHCELTPVEVGSKEFHMINTYMKNTHAKTHSNYTAEIVQIFRASKHGEADSFSKFSNIKNRMLLWHGSRLTNWFEILSEGLRIDPPEVPVTGDMFGKGVYFADMFSKSANYCRASKQAPDGVLLLCEVALGEMVELLTANRDADKLPQGKLSTKGIGASGPDMSKNETLEDGVVVPLGRPKKQLMSKQPKLKDGLFYNEYVVYNANQIRMRYVVHVNINFKKHVRLEMEK